MSGEGKWRAQINNAEQLLKKLALLEECNAWVRYSNDIPSTVRDMSYVEEYWFYIGQRLYDFLLVDHGLFQFKIEDKEDISYCYYQPPFEAPTYQEYVADIMGDPAFDIKEIGDLFAEEYQLVVGTARLRQGVTPIRYDFTPAIYEEGVHPAAHIHIGTGNEIRLCTTRLMQPGSFVLFVIRQMYPEQWRLFLQSDNAAKFSRLVRDDLDPVDGNFSKVLDRWQLVLD